MFGFGVRGLFNYKKILNMIKIDYNKSKSLILLTSVIIK